MIRGGSLLVGLLVAGAAPAATVVLTVERAGAPVEDTVVSLHPVDRPADAKPEQADMDQRDLQFVPHILAVTVGSEVRFPNSDRLRHQVYSFSKAKTFDLPLYSGHPSKPVIFGEAGIVELGCNIHDGMIGYIVVLDTPHHAVTDAAGRATLDVPDGDYRLEAWHETLPAGAPPRVRANVHVADGAPQELTVPLDRDD